MKRLFLTSVAALFLATAAAHAKPVAEYQCGETWVTYSPIREIKDQPGVKDRPAGEEISIARRVPDRKSSGRAILSSGRVILEDGLPAYYVLGRKKYKCKEWK